MFLFPGEKCSVKLTLDSEANRVVFAEGATTPNMFLDNDGGYVKGLIVYMVTDDLSITPLSMISALSKLDMCTNAESNTEFEVKIVEFGVNEVSFYFIYFSRELFNLYILIEQFILLMPFNLLLEVVTLYCQFVEVTFSISFQ
ncbi:hypothetical protein H5410_028195 [Solanum commersonii]|uniref:Uncharacterized protein n=1 Tax=Solanum commersonii TaxID=4109 RepID=A0A9J5Z492_SOLCO|nr:hypothetical protein H5410_028195 [Solanum commersonii]